MMRRPTRTNCRTMWISERAELDTMRVFSIFILLVAALADESADNRLARDIYRDLVEINTTESSGDTTKAAEAMADRLRAAGFPESDIHVLGPHPRKGNLVARYRGTGQRKPLLLLAHLDVVEARREDWSIDPFKFLEKD